MVVGPLRRQSGGDLHGPSREVAAGTVVRYKRLRRRTHRAAIQRRAHPHRFARRDYKYDRGVAFNHPQLRQQRQRHRHRAPPRAARRLPGLPAARGAGLRHRPGGDGLCGHQPGRRHHRHRAGGRPVEQDAGDEGDPPGRRRAAGEGDGRRARRAVRRGRVRAGPRAGAGQPQGEAAADRQGGADTRRDVGPSGQGGRVVLHASCRVPRRATVMKVKKYGPLALPPWRFLEWYTPPLDPDDPGLSTAFFSRAMFVGHDWAGQPPLASRVKEMPLFWGYESADLSARFDYAQPALPHVIPPCYWGKPGSLIAIPRALIFPHYFDTGAEEDPPFYTVNVGRTWNKVIAAATLELAGPLARANVYAGPAAEVGARDFSAVPCGLPWTDVEAFWEAAGGRPEGQDCYAKVFTPGSGAGGEVLYVSLGDSLNERTYFDLVFDEYEDFDVLKGKDEAYLEACHKEHARARWLRVQGLGKDEFPGDPPVEERYYDGQKNRDILDDLN